MVNKYPYPPRTAAWIIRDSNTLVSHEQDHYLEQEFYWGEKYFGDENPMGKVLTVSEDP